MGTALNSTSGLVPMVFSLVGVLFALKYLKGQADFSKGISAVFWAFACVLAAKLLIWPSAVLGEGYYYFLELLLRLLSAVFFIAGALEIKGVKFVNRTVLIAACLVAAVWSWYVVIITKDGGTLSLSMALSTVGYGVLAASLWSKKSLRNALGFVITGWFCIFLVVYNLLIMMSWGQSLVSPSFETFLYIAIMCGLILISNNLLAHQFEGLAQEAAESKERLRLMIQMSPFPIIISRLKDDQLMLINTKAGALFGLDVRHPGNFKTVDYLADPSSRRELLARLEKKPVVDDFEILVKPRKGEPFWLLLSARVIDFEYEIALYMAFQDITGRKKKELKLFDQATRDPLTNCYNRRQFEELAKNEVQRSRRYNHPFCLFMIDADHFKNVNDTHGHAVGDLVLQALANCCRMTLRESDIIARFGGEEFVILLPEVSIENAHRVAERLRIKISKLVVKNEQNEDVRFTVSIGLVSSTLTDNIDEMLKMADDALYVAKENGRNRVIIYDKDGPNKDTVPPTGEDIEKTSAEPLYYFKSSAPAPLKAGAGVPSLDGGAAAADEEDVPLDDEEEIDHEPVIEGRGVSLDDLYDVEEEEPSPAAPAPQTPAASFYEPAAPADFEEELEPEIEDDLPPEEEAVEAENVFAHGFIEEEAVSLPEEEEEPAVPSYEPEIIDDLPSEPEEDVFAGTVGVEPPAPVFEDDSAVDLTAEPEIEEEEAFTPPPLTAVPPPMPPSPPPAPGVSPDVRRPPMVKKIPIKVPPGMMKVKMPKMPGVVRVKIPKGPHPGTGPVPPRPGKPEGEE